MFPAGTGANATPLLLPLEPFLPLDGVRMLRIISASLADGNVLVSIGKHTTSAHQAGVAQLVE